jgi:hypothetical protein
LQEEFSECWKEFPDEGRSDLENDNHLLFMESEIQRQSGGETRIGSLADLLSHHGGTGGLTAKNPRWLSVLGNTIDSPGGRYTMGIITESPGSRTERSPTERSPLDTIELVRTKVDDGSPVASQPIEAKSIQKPSPTIISGNQSLTVNDKCVIYRNLVSRQRIVTIIPIRSIDSFAVQIFKPKWIRWLAIFFFTISILIGLGILALLYGKHTMGEFLGSWAPGPRLVWIPFLSLLLGIIGLVASAFSARTELVIYNRSGNHQVQLSLSDKMRDSVEQFVVEIEAQMGRI